MEAQAAVKRTIQVTDEADGKLCEIVPDHLIGKGKVTQRFNWAAFELHRLVRGKTSQAMARPTPQAK